MKKFISLLIIFILSACASPQETVTSEVTVTLVPPTAPPTAIPTPTLHPEFIAWQELISSSGRYTLTSDGFIQDNGSVINGLQVDSKGIMTLTVNNEKIILNTSDITFIEDGIKINGYELQNGFWVEAEETVKIDGVTMVLEDQDGDGISEVIGMSIEGDYTDEEKAEMLAEFDFDRLGLEDKAVWTYNEATQELELVATDDPSVVIAKYSHGSKDVTWDVGRMIEIAEDVPFMDHATTWEMQGSSPVDREQAKLDSAKLDSLLDEWTIKEYGGRRSYASSFYLYDTVGTTAIGGILITDELQDPMLVNRTDVIGHILFLDENGELVDLKVKNFDCTTRFWH